MAHGMSGQDFCSMLTMPLNQHNILHLELYVKGGTSLVFHSMILRPCSFWYRPWLKVLRKFCSSRVFFFRDEFPIVLINFTGRILWYPVHPESQLSDVWKSILTVEFQQPELFQTSYNPKGGGTIEYSCLRGKETDTM